MNIDVIRIEKPDQPTLLAILKLQQLGIINETNKHKILYKDSGGNPVTFPAEGNEASFSSLAVSGLAGTGDRNIGVDASGNIIQYETPTPEETYIPLVGVLENKDYVAKIDDSTISVDAGSGIIRKADLSENLVTWNATTSFTVAVPEGELRWIVMKWDAGEAFVEPQVVQYMPTTIDEFEQCLLIGRVWKENGVLEVSGRHILLSVDPQSSRTSWWQLPSGNRSVGIGYSTVDTGLLSLTAGELIRHPVVELSTYHHVWEFPAFESVTSAWRHVQNTTGFVRISDNSAGNDTDIRAIADYYDSGGTIISLPNNKFVAHLIGCYAGSNERVIFFGQHVYDTISEAEIGIEADELVVAQWASDLGQISKIGWLITQKGVRDFSNTGSVKFVPYSLVGGGGGIGNTPNLDQVIAVGGDVDLTPYPETDRVVSYLRNGVRLLSIFGDGRQASAQSNIAILGAGAVQVQDELRCIARALFAGASDTGASISVIDQPSTGGELFDVINFDSDTEGLYTLSAQVDIDYGEAVYEYDSGTDIYYAFKGNVTGVGAYWFVGTTILTGDSAFTNCQYRSANPVTLPSTLPSDPNAGGYTGVNAPDTGQQGGFTSQSGGGAESINAETIVVKSGKLIGTDTANGDLYLSGGQTPSTSAGPHVQLVGTSPTARLGLNSNTYIIQTGTKISLWYNGVEMVTLDASSVILKSPDTNNTVTVSNAGVNISTGTTGTFTSNDGKTITVTNGIITGIV